MKRIFGGLRGGTTSDELIIDTLIENGIEHDVLSVQTDTEQILVGKVAIGDEHIELSQTGLKRLIKQGHSPEGIIKDVLSASIFRTR